MLAASLVSNFKIGRQKTDSALVIYSKVSRIQPQLLVCQNSDRKMALGRKRKEVDESQIDLTPMLDVVFIMLIFFIVTQEVWQDLDY